MANENDKTVNKKDRRVVPYEVFREKQLQRDYGDPIGRLRAMNFAPDFNPFADEYEIDDGIGDTED